MFLIQKYPDIFFVTSLCFTMSLSLCFFSSYHFYLILKNLTTNDSTKISSLKYEFSENIQENLIKIKQLKETCNEMETHKLKIQNQEKSTVLNKLNELQKEITNFENVVKNVETKNRILDSNYYNYGIWSNLKEFFS